MHSEFYFVKSIEDTFWYQSVCIFSFTLAFAYGIIKIWTQIVPALEKKMGLQPTPFMVYEKYNVYHDVVQPNKNKYVQNVPRKRHNRQHYG